MEFFEQVFAELYRRSRRRRKRIGVKFWRIVQEINAIVWDAECGRDFRLSECFPEAGAFGALVYPHETFFRDWSVNTKAWFFNHPLWRWARKQCSEKFVPDEQVSLFVDQLNKRLNLGL